MKNYIEAEKGMKKEKQKVFMAIKREVKSESRFACLDCKNYFWEGQVVQTPEGFRCQNCIREEDIDENKDNPLSQKVGYFANEDNEKNDCE